MKNSWKPLAAVCVLVIGVYAYLAQSGELELLTPNAADAFYNLLAQGFRAGQLSLNKDVPPGFAQLADPYDPTANALYRSAPYWLHDLSYYKGRLYLYYGVTPALLLFWPYAALTGQYLFHRQAVTIFCAIGFLVSVGLLRALWRRYFAEVSIWVVAACALALGLAAGLPGLLTQSDVYEVSISCGYMLTMLALAGIWCAMNEPERRCRWLLLASVAYGLAVGARPSFLFGAVILLVPVAQAWRERRQVWAVSMAAISPILLIGLGLMLYNARRFDTPFEFGQHYMLAGDSHRRQLFSPGYLWFNFRVYFLEPARWSAHFPFVHAIVVPPLPPGHLRVETPFGILSNIPLAWLALAVPLAWRNRSEQSASTLRWFVMAVALLFGSCAVTIGLFYGASLRYQVDILPSLVLLAVIGILGLERVLAPISQSAQAHRPPWRRAARWGWGLLLGFSVAFNLLASIEHYAEANNLLGLYLQQAGRVPEAIAQYEQALRFEPDYAKARNNLGNALWQTGRIPEAIEQYDQAIRINPDLAEIHINLGNALLASGRTTEAIGHFQQALRIKPDEPAIQNNLAWLLATLAPAEGGDPVRAVTLAERVCSLTTNSASTYLDTLAAAYASAGRFDDAVATAQKAIDLANSAGLPQVAKQIEPRLQLYRRGQPYRRTVDPTNPPNPWRNPPTP
jgi:tetratricopeptide (TPR) repeat protein